MPHTATPVTKWAMMSSSIISDEYDSPWKDALEHAFPEFMAFYFPQAHSEIDWAQGHEFQNTELRQIVRDAELGKRYADALVKVTLGSGEERLIYIHIEVQGQRDSSFAQRMFTSNYRLYDRHATPIASLAVLADDERIDAGIQGGARSGDLGRGRRGGGRRGIRHGFSK